MELLFWTLFSFDQNNIVDVSEDLNIETQRPIFFLQQRLQELSSNFCLIQSNNVGAFLDHFFLFPTTATGFQGPVALWALKHKQFIFWINITF